MKTLLPLSLLLGLVACDGNIEQTLKDKQQPVIPQQPVKSSSVLVQIQ
jgi:hypothetical protein